MAAFRSMITRMIIVCSEEYKNKELHRILEIAKKNGYSTMTILNLKKKMNDKMLNNTEKTKINKFVGSMDYIEGLSENIVNILKKEKVNIGLKLTSKIMNLIRNDKDKPKEADKNGVYCIPITREDGTESCYIGMTKRRIEVRMKEHMRDIAQGKSTTALAKLNLEEEINIEFENMKIISPYTTKIQTMMTESLEIIYGKRNPCNSEASYFLPLSWRKFMRSSALKPVTENATTTTNDQNETQQTTDEENTGTNREPA